MEEVLRALMLDVLELDDEELTDDSSMYNVESWDSLSHLSIITDLEDVFEVEFTADEMVEMTSVVSIKRILGEKDVRWT